MAIEQLQPGADVDDWTSLETCVLLLGETGEPVSLTTLRRLIKRHGIRTARFGMKGQVQVHVSFSKVLVIHRDWVDGRLGIN